MVNLKPSLEDAFSDLFTPETLEGSNRYFCDQCNAKSDAIKGIKIVELPFLLCIQINRFTLDFINMKTVKNNDKLKFPLLLNMGEGYNLSSVIVSAGSANSGSLFVCATDSEKWYKFDDTR